MFFLTDLFVNTIEVLQNSVMCRKSKTLKDFDYKIANVCEAIIAACVWEKVMFPCCLCLCVCVCVCLSVCLSVQPISF